jgi:hypothetical protein
MNMNEQNQDNYQNSEYSKIATRAGKSTLRQGGKLLKKGSKALTKGLGKALFALIKTVGPYILLAIIIPVIAYAIFTFVSEATVDNFVSTLEIDAPSTDTDSLLAYIESTDDTDKVRYLAEYNINLDILKQYMTLENDTLEKDKESTIRLETTTKKTDMNGKTTMNQKNTKNYSNITLEKAQASYPYRLYWQLLAGIDIYMKIADISEEYTWDRIIPSKAKSHLMPEFAWSRENQYTREVLSKTETIVINKYDDIVTSEETTLIEEKYIYPLPYLKKVKTAFGTYNFNYTDKITTTEHEWGDYVISEGTVEHHTSSTSSGYYKKKDPVTGKLVDDHTKPYYDTWTTQTITKTRRSKTYQVDENLLKGEPEFIVDITSFDTFIQEANLDYSELHEIYNTITKLPNSYECVEALSIALNEYGLLDSLDGISLHTSRPIDLDITLPHVAGEYSRNDVTNAAQSLLGVPYFWGGKHNEIGLNTDWGSLRQVTLSGNWSTGKTLPYGLDCSGFISWAYNQVLLPKGQVFPDGTLNQYASAMLIPISESELQPGDIGYTKGIDHVGMYIGTTDDLKMFIHAGGRLYSSSGKPAGQVVISYNNSSTYYEGNAPTKFINFFRLKYRFKGE